MAVAYVQQCKGEAEGGRGSSTTWAAMGVSRGVTWARHDMGEVRAGRGHDSGHVPLFDVRCSEFGQELGPTSYTKDLHLMLSFHSY